MTPLPLSRDAATVFSLAGPALAYASSTDEEVERWLRALRLFGEAGDILQRLAIGEVRLTPVPTLVEQADARRPEETLAAVSAGAEEFATQRGRSSIGTVDLLVAVMRHYAEAFERALESRGSDRWELVDCLSQRLHAPLREAQLH
jgi:hypothetical protein